MRLAKGWLLIRYHIQSQKSAACLLSHSVRSQLLLCDDMESEIDCWFVITFSQKSTAYLFSHSESNINCSFVVIFSQKLTALCICCHTWSQPTCTESWRLHILFLAYLYSWWWTWNIKAWGQTTVGFLLVCQFSYFFFSIFFISVFVAVLMCTCTSPLWRSLNVHSDLAPAICISLPWWSC